MSCPYSRLLTNSLLENNYSKSLEYSLELISAGFYDEFWRVCLSILIEYIHIFRGTGPSFFYEQYSKFKEIKKNSTDSKFESNVYPIIQCLIHTLSQNYKQHISMYIKSQYNPTNKISTSETKILFVSLHNTLQLLVDRKNKNLQINDKTSIKLQTLIGQILSIDCDSITNLDNDINLFTHTFSKLHESISNTLWNILLSNSKKITDKNIHKNIECLAKLYYTKLLNFLNKQSLIVVCAAFYFIYVYDYTDQQIISERIETELFDSIDDNIKNDSFHMCKVYKLLNKSKKKTDKQIKNDTEIMIKQTRFDFDVEIVGKITKDKPIITEKTIEVNEKILNTMTTKSNNYTIERIQNQ